jgi:hypothetical protein
MFRAGLQVPVVHGSTRFGGDEVTRWPTVMMTDTDWKLVRRAIDRAFAEGAFGLQWQANVLSKLNGRIDAALAELDTKR